MMYPCFLVFSLFQLRYLHLSICWCSRALNSMLKTATETTYCILWLFIPTLTCTLFSAMSGQESRFRTIFSYLHIHSRALQLSVLSERIKFYQRDTKFAREASRSSCAVLCVGWSKPTIWSLQENQPRSLGMWVSRCTSSSAHAMRLIYCLF